MNSRDLGVKGLRVSESDSECFYAKQHNSKSFLVRVL